MTLISYRAPLKIQSSPKCKARKTKFQSRVTFRVAGTKIWIFKGALQFHNTSNQITATFTSAISTAALPISLARFMR